MRSVAMQRSRPHTAALKALPAQAFDTLLAADRDLVCRYYGLDDDRPETLAQLAAVARQGKTRVR
jgi:DNA-directed RNA polymerase sigma subunit (sigma70/sigma32)